MEEVFLDLVFKLSIDIAKSGDGVNKKSPSVGVTEGLDTIFLLSPTTSVARIRRGARPGGGVPYGMSRPGVTRARADAGNTTVGGTNAGAIGRLREMQERIESMEAEVEAHDVINDPKKADIEERFRKLERGETRDTLDDEIAALKARLKK